MQEELADLRTMVDRLRNEKRAILTQLRELGSAVGNLEADAGQRSVRLVENQALFVGRVTSILQAAGLPMDTLSPGMYLGSPPNPLAMSVEDLARSAPRVYGHLIGEPNNLNADPIPSVEQAVAGPNFVDVVNIDMSQPATTHLADNGVRAQQEMVVDSRPTLGSNSQSGISAGPSPPIYAEATPSVNSEIDRKSVV